MLQKFEHFQHTSNSQYEQSFELETLENELKLNIKLNNGYMPNELLSYLATKGEVSHFVELIPSVNDIFIQTVKDN